MGLIYLIYSQHFKWLTKQAQNPNKKSLPEHLKGSYKSASNLGIY